jgi:ketosteroid isomerase-like protein
LANLAGNLSVNHFDSLFFQPTSKFITVTYPYFGFNRSISLSDDLLGNANVDEIISFLVVSKVKVEFMSQIKKNLSGDLTSLQTRINQYCAAWTTQAGEPDWSTIEQLYANEDLLHYDAVTPHSFANVADMKKAFAEMKKGLGLISLKLKTREDLQTFRREDLVWTTVLQDIIAKTKDGKELKFVQRQTGIWEKRNGNWVMVHEHLSAPSSLQDK